MKNRKLFIQEKNISICRLPLWRPSYPGRYELIAKLVKETIEHLFSGISQHPTSPITLHSSDPLAIRAFEEGVSGAESG